MDASCTKIRAKVHKQQTNLASKWKRTAEPELKKLQAKKESQAKKEVKVIEPAKGPLFEEIDKENDINEDLWNAISPRKKYKSKKRVPMTRTKHA